MNNEMMINTYLSTTDSKINKHAEQEQTHRYRQHFDGCQMGGGWGMTEKSEEINKYKLVVIA